MRARRTKDGGDAGGRWSAEVEQDEVKGRAWSAGTAGVLAGGYSRCDGWGGVRHGENWKTERNKRRLEKWSSAAKCVLLSGGNTNRVVHKKTAKLQLVSGPLPPRFVVCQDSGPTEVIESEHGGGPSGRRAAGKATTPSQLERADEPRVASAASGEATPQAPTTPGAVQPRLTSHRVPRCCVFYVSGATAMPRCNPNVHLSV